MRYMRWSYDDLCRCPAAYVPIIAEESHRTEAPRQPAPARRRR